LSTIYIPQSESLATEGANFVSVLGKGALVAAQHLLEAQTVAEAIAPSRSGGDGAFREWGGFIDP